MDEFVRTVATQWQTTKFKTLDAAKGIRYVKIGRASRTLPVDDLLDKVSKLQEDGIAVVAGAKDEFKNHAIFVGDAGFEDYLMKGDRVLRYGFDLYYRHAKLVDAPVRLFLDLDPVLPEGHGIEGTEGAFEAFLVQLVGLFIDLLGAEGTLDATANDPSIKIDYGLRQIKGGVKCSAHIVFCGVLFGSMKELGLFMKRAKRAVLQGEGVHFARTYGGVPSFASDHLIPYTQTQGVVWDDKVYTPGRYLRGANQAKNGDRRTILKMGAFENSGEEPRWVSEEDTGSWRARDPFPWDLPVTYRMNAPSSSVPEAAEAPARPLHSFEFKKTIGLIKNSLWPEYTARRAQIAAEEKKSVHFFATEFPSDSPVTARNGYLYMEFPAHEDDRFCLHDPNGHHSQNQDGKLSYTVNLTLLTVTQRCWVCSGGAPCDFVAYPLLQSSGHTPARRRQYSGPALGSAATMAHTIQRWGAANLLRIFCHYAEPDILFRPLDKQHGESFFVYCAKNNERIWVCDAITAANILYENAEKFIHGFLKEQALLKAYFVEHISYIKEAEQNPGDETEPPTLESVKETDFMGSDFFSVARTGWQKLQATIDKSLYRAIQKWTPSGVELDPLQHCVPMADGNLFNTITGELRPIQKKDYVTAKSGAKLLTVPDPNSPQGWRLDLDHEECKEINKWFMDVAAQREELATYLKQLCGYAFTSLTFDRKFYVFFGVGSDGKSTIGKFFQEALGSERYFSVPASFFGDAQNRSTGAEAATANACQFYRKTCAMTEDMSCGMLQASKIKSYSAGDRISGRRLYGNTFSWKQTAKLFFATNVEPRFTVLDQAIRDRVQIIPMDTRWVSQPNASLGEKKADPVYLEKLLTFKDAFATVALHALHQHFNENGVTFFPVPSCVAARTEQYISDNNRHMSFIKDCLRKEKEMMECGTCCRGVVDKSTMYQAFRFHVQAKGGKVSETDTEADFVKQMAAWQILVCPLNGKYPYYHLASAEAYCGPHHSVPLYDLIRKVDSDGADEPPPKRARPTQRISADANI